jgi:hypothetical protein
MLGKGAAMKVTHGRKIIIATRHRKHHLGQMVLEADWEVQMTLNKDDVANMEWLNQGKQV